MLANLKVRWGWLKFMYIYTIVFSGGFGLGMIFVPEVIKTVGGWPDADPIIWGVIASIYVAFGILSIFGLQSPLKFVPVLFLQLCYKSIWFIAIVLPLLLTGKFPSYAILTAAIFATFVLGDLIAIPFSYIFAKQPEPVVE
jgi:hypothetical protein